MSLIFRRELFSLFVLISVMPADLILSAIPSDTKNLAINETLTMICSGSVGTVRKHTEVITLRHYDGIKYYDVIKYDAQSRMEICTHR